jgi:hypothetical protein
VLQLDLGHDHCRQVAQRGDFVVACRARHPVEHAHRAERMAVAGNQRRARVEADTGGNQRTAGEARIVAHVLDDENIRTFSHPRTRRLEPRNLSAVGADMRLEPLPVVVSQRYRGDGDAKQAAGHAGDAIERFALDRVEQPQVAQRGESPGLLQHRRVGPETRKCRRARPACRKVHVSVCTCMKRHDHGTLAK